MTHISSPFCSPKMGKWLVGPIELMGLIGHIGPIKTYRPY